MGVRRRMIIFDITPCRDSSLREVFVSDQQKRGFLCSPLADRMGLPTRTTQRCQRNATRSVAGGPTRGLALVRLFAELRRRFDVNDNDNSFLVGGIDGSQTRQSCSRIVRNAKPTPNQCNICTDNPSSHYGGLVPPNATDRVPS